MEHLRDLTAGNIRTELGSQDRECSDHGPYASVGYRWRVGPAIWSRCPKCEEIREANDLRIEAEKKAAEHRARIERMMQSSCIPRRFQDRVFDTFIADTSAKQKALSVAREYAENFNEHRKRGESLIFLGAPGTGKSHLAVAILHALMPDDVGLYCTCMGMIRRLRDTWRKDSDVSESDVLRQLEQVPLLVIDEIGVQYGTDGEQNIIFEVLDRRYREQMPTILLTNQDIDGLRSMIGDRCFDRLRETAKSVAFDWPSCRKAARIQYEAE